MVKYFKVVSKFITLVVIVRGQVHNFSRFLQLRSSGVAYPTVL